MKYGLRTPSVKKSFSARTTGAVKRNIKRSINPTYGKKGMGYINNPEKAIYNKIYNKTTYGISNGNVYTHSNLKSMTVAELKSILRSKGLKVSGNKQELIDRLLTYNQQCDDSYTYNTTNRSEDNNKSHFFGFSVLLSMCALLFFALYLFPLGVLCLIGACVCLIIPLISN